VLVGVKIIKTQHIYTQRNKSVETGLPRRVRDDWNTDSCAVWAFKQEI